MSIDESCLDPSRLFYTPRHPKGGQWRIALTGGEPLDIAVVPEVEPKKRDEATDPFLSAGKQLGGNADDSLYIDDFSLKGWARDHAEGFQIAQVFQAHAPERIRAEREEGRIEVECPFDGEHNNLGDTDDRGTFCADGHSNSNPGGFAFHCQHNACSGRDRLQLLHEAFKQGWFPMEALTGGEFDAILLDGGSDEEDGDQPSEIKFHEVMQRAKAFTPETDPEEIEQLLRDPHRSTTSRLKIERLIDILVDKAKQKRSALRGASKEIAEEVGVSTLLNQSMEEDLPLPRLILYAELKSKSSESLFLFGIRGRQRHLSVTSIA